MTNEVDYSPKRYIGNGTTKEFPFDWKIFNDSDLKVVFEDSEGVQTEQSDYTVVAEAMGGNVIFNVAPPANCKIIIARAIPLYQSVGYSTSTGFQGSELEKSFDKTSAVVQDLYYTLKRAVKVPLGSPNLDLTLPNPDPRKVIVWNNDGTGFDNTETSIDNIARLEESAKNSAQHAEEQAQIATGAVNDLYNNEGYQAVTQDLLGENTIGTCATNIEDIKTVAYDITNVNNVGRNIDNVNAVARNETNINAVNANKANIDNVAGNRDNINAVNANKANINTVSTNIANVNKVGNNINNVNAVAGNETNINAVKANETNINQVVARETEIENVSNNISVIENASVFIDTVYSHIDCGHISNTATPDIIYNCGSISDNTYDSIYDCGNINSSGTLFGGVKRELVELKYEINTANAVSDERYDELKKEVQRLDNTDAYLEEKFDSEVLRLNGVDEDLQLQLDTAFNTLAERLQGDEMTIQNIEEDLSANIAVTQSHSDFNTQLYNVINCGHISNTATPDVIYNCGRISDNTFDFKVVCGTPNDSGSMLMNVIVDIATLKAEVKNLSEMLSSIIGMAERIDCGSI